MGVSQTKGARKVYRVLEGSWGAPEGSRSGSLHLVI